jgi:hypothetical protein
MSTLPSPQQGSCNQGHSVCCQPVFSILQRLPSIKTSLRQCRTLLRSISNCLTIWVPLNSRETANALPPQYLEERKIQYCLMTNPPRVGRLNRPNGQSYSSRLERLFFHLVEIQGPEVDKLTEPLNVSDCCRSRVDTSGFDTNSLIPAATRTCFGLLSSEVGGNPSPMHYATDTLDCPMWRACVTM